MSDRSDSPAVGDDFYRRIFEQAAMAMVATDTQYNVIALNPAAEPLLNRPAAQITGRSIKELVPAERHSLLEKLLRRVARTGKVSQLEIHAPGVGGSEGRDLVVILSPIPAADGSCQGIAAWIIDETGRKRMSERLAQAEKMASLGTLAGGVAHHFNNILGGVATFVDFALTSGDVGSMKRALQMTAEAASRASRITQSLLSFAAKDTHRTDLADLTEVVLTFTHLVERPLGERGIRLVLDLQPVPIVAVEANRMHQVLGNLLTNAEEALPEGGDIVIRLERSDEHVLMTFSDTGCGVRPEHLPLVFEPFFTTKGLLAGGDQANPGLGLSVVHGIVLDMGGSIRVESTLGQGTSFLITFPINRD
jgi:PAS domain S-box-containing protein